VIEGLKMTGQVRSGGDVNPTVSAVIGQMMSNGSLEEHVALLRKTYTHRRRALTAALEKHCGHFGLTWQCASLADGQAGGYFLFCTLPDTLNCDAGDVLSAAQRAGSELTFITGDKCTAAGNNTAAVAARDPQFHSFLRRSFRLSWSFYDEEDLERAAKELGEAIWDANVKFSC
jgi:DNA-binding transcriptional MocR family regulator